LPERVTTEADAVLAALAVLAPTTTPSGDGQESLALELARTAAPAFAAGLGWGAWERALRFGTEASRLAGEVAEQAYFHHELGVLALCGGQLDRARAELEASIGLRGAVADKRGTVAGRRALALVDDRAGTTPLPVAAAAFGRSAGEEVPDARTEESALPPGGSTTPFPAVFQPSDEASTQVTYRPVAMGAPSAPQTSYRPLPDTPAKGSKKRAGGLKGLARRNLVAVGAGALLAAVLGTVVTLGATSDDHANDPSDTVGVDPSASQGTDDGSLDADTPQDGGGDPADGQGEATSRPTDPGADGRPGTADDSAPPGRAEPSDSVTPPGAGGASGNTSGSSASGGASSSSGATGDGGTSGDNPGEPTGGSSGDSSGDPTGGSTDGPTGSPTGGETGAPTGSPTGGDTSGTDGGQPGETTGDPTGGPTGGTTTDGTTGDDSSRTSKTSVSVPAGTASGSAAGTPSTTATAG
jgi:hypothetical protein